MACNHLRAKFGCAIVFFLAAGCGNVAFPPAEPTEAPMAARAQPPADRSVSPAAMVPPPVAEREQAPIPASPETLLAVLIAGFDSDPTPEQIAGAAQRGEGRSGLYQFQRELTPLGITTRFFNWDGTDAGHLGRGGAPGPKRITDFVRQYHGEHPQAPVVVIGNSWGGETAMQLVTLLNAETPPVPVAQLHLLDASSFLRGQSFRAGMPDNVAAVANFYTHNLFTNGALPAAGRVENIDLGDPKNGFLRRGWRGYQDNGDIGAHVFVEWDPRVQRALVERIQKLLTDRP